MFRELGAEVLDADRLGHEALDDAEIRRRVVKAFGQGVVGRDGRIDRKLLGTRVFRSNRQLKRLEAIVHPWVLDRIGKTLDHWRERPRPPRLVVLDIVLLLESGADALCDRILYIRAPRRARAERAVRDRAWDAGELARRERYQRSLVAKRRVSDEVIDNDGSLGETRRQVRAIFRSLVRASRRGLGPRRRPQGGEWGPSCSPRVRRGARSRL